MAQEKELVQQQARELSSYWPTTVRVDTDMDSFWLVNEERMCKTYPDDKGRVSVVSCKPSDSYKDHNIPVKFWGEWTGTWSLTGDAAENLTSSFVARSTNLLPGHLTRIAEIQVPTLFARASYNSGPERQDGGGLKNNQVARQIYGSPTVLKKCLTDPKFAYVVALARAVNALNAAHSLMMSTESRDTPAAVRDRMSAHFFVSGILYESLELIRRMSKVFRSDKSFETHLRLILKDTSGQTLERMHLKSVRHGGVFHFLPDRFAEAIAKTGMTDSIFAATLGDKRGDIHYSFYDYITAEMMVGGRLDDHVVVTRMIDRTLNLVNQFVDHSENFIGDQLHGWGFKVRPASPGAPENQSQG